MELTEATRVTAAILLFALVTVETGGMYLVRVVRGAAPATPFQLAFARAGHAHAGVLLVLSLVGLLYADAAGLDGGVGVVARSGVPAAALLMSGGFFFASMGAGRTQPNRLIVLVSLGAVALAAGLVALGVGLLRS
ncbi:hypothetical protein [Egicoccus sp. AB-alg6-2]|uniref:hypothetical protein n=1 Tax=Egicoccus sp. AB-alg6-2 TaxID=3242692 RepID=UPI00359E1085